VGDSSTAASQPIVETRRAWHPVVAWDAPPSVEGERLKPNTKVGFYSRFNMPHYWQIGPERGRQPRSHEGAGLA
jgi:hypothetical protein